MTAGARLAAPADLAAAAEVLTAAFMEYPWTRYVLPEDDYPGRLLELQRLYLTHALHYGIVAVSAHVAGVIALLPPDAPQPARSVITRIVALHGDRIDRLASNPHPHLDWRLETLGVLPDARGSGIGGALIRFALEESARRGARAVRLETSDERNVRLYERHGFGVIEYVDAGGAPPIWTMRAVVPAQ
ncbi:GNAT family N-acetyltransferase [Agromyces silvae]|uniref:GNAT family N-acetyltransferase n=1 Tax=Agromyces silvae TaxID=3388266 RepID=UPI00280A5FA5|nr:GNAT family N-acetyltransferase [Agromyces protaetiae]